MRDILEEDQFHLCLYLCYLLNRLKYKPVLLNIVKAIKTPINAPVNYAIISKIKYLRSSLNLP